MSFMDSTQLIEILNNEKKRKEFHSISVRLYPNDCKQILKEFGTTNRKVSIKNQKEIKSAIENNTWVEYNSSTISFDENGKLYDGYQRLFACSKAQTGSLTCTVVFGVTPNVYTDTGMKRTLKDNLYTMGIIEEDLNRFITTKTMASIEQIRKQVNETSLNQSENIEKFFKYFFQNNKEKVKTFEIAISSLEKGLSKKLGTSYTIFRTVLFNYYVESCVCVDDIEKIYCYLLEQPTTLLSGQEKILSHLTKKLNEIKGSSLMSNMKRMELISTCLKYYINESTNNQCDCKRKGLIAKFTLEQNKLLNFTKTVDDILSTKKNKYIDLSDSFYPKETKTKKEA